MFSSRNVLVLLFSGSEEIVCGSAWRWDTVPLCQVPQHLRVYGIGQRELMPRGGPDNENAKIEEELEGKAGRLARKLW